MLILRVGDTKYRFSDVQINPLVIIRFASSVNYIIVVASFQFRISRLQKFRKMQNTFGKGEKHILKIFFKRVSPIYVYMLQKIFMIYRAKIYFPAIFSVTVCIKYSCKHAVHYMQSVPKLLGKPNEWYRVILFILLTLMHVRINDSYQKYDDIKYNWRSASASGIKTFREKRRQSDYLFVRIKKLREMNHSLKKKFWTLLQFSKTRIEMIHMIRNQRARLYQRQVPPQRFRGRSVGKIFVVTKPSIACGEVLLWLHWKTQTCEYSKGHFKAYFVFMRESACGKI